jgi:hypothetical protein
MTKQTGFYILRSSNPRIKDSLAYSCTTCGVGYVFGDSEPRAFCCNSWITPPKKTFWSGDLPVVQSAVAWKPVSLRGKVIDFADGADVANAESFGL